jgi:leucyl aminopeptidase
MVGSVPRFDVATGSPAKQRADLLLLPAFQGPEAGPGVREVGRALDVEITSLLEEDGFRGSLGEISTLPTLGRGEARTVAVLGLGPKDEATSERIRRAAGRAAATAGRYKTVAATVPAGGKGPWREAVQAFVEGILLGAYRFDRYKVRPVEDEAPPPRWDRITVLAPPRWDAKGAREALRRGEIVAEAVSWARDLVNTPALDATPDFLAKEARRMSRAVGLECNVLTKADLEKGGFGGIIGVGRGSENPPRLIELRYEGGGRGKPVALTGKGVTFDSGGLSIKDAKQMEWMKSDMAGAATMLAAMRAIARLKPKVNVIAAIPSAENLPGGAAIRPGDVLRHRGGKTSEVLNTDAEGRLILADALAYLAERDPAVIVDAATLTGAAMIALGQELWAVMGSDRALVRELLDAGRDAGEPGWELPLWTSYRKQIKSNVADVKNIGDRYGGAITAGLFLKEFVGDVPWAHLDIAGTAFAEKGGDYWPAGATGNPVRTVIRFVERRARRS